jgi:hypothetical protein
MSTPAGSDHVEEAAVVLPDQPTSPPVPRDAANWAPKVTRLEVSADQQDTGWGVAGRRLTGPQQGFGKLWQRTYTANIGNVATPTEAVALWRSDFGAFWPKGNRFHGALGGITPGDVAPIAVAAGGGFKLATGVLVLYADDESFTFMTPEGHMFAGWITFSASEQEGSTVLQAQLLMRPNDPLYELAMPVMKRMEDRFWSATIRNLATRLGATDVVVHEQSAIVDRRKVWRNASNIRHNAGIRSMLRLLTAPLRALRRLVRKS